MQRPKIDTYFADKGIKVHYNTLGHTEELVRSYVSQFQLMVDGSNRKKSQDVKYSCYQQLYPMIAREKLTGFENIKKQDQAFREKVRPNIIESQFSPLLPVEPGDNKLPNPSYKAELLSELRRVDKPLLYLSGGIDSELVACALLETGKEFNLVVFEWLDDSGNVLNKNDVSYAYAFCKAHGLVPMIKQVNVERLWRSEEFEKLAIDMQIMSTHLMTHAYAVTVMAPEFSDHTHLFGGEVRYYSNSISQSGDFLNIVYLDKLTPQVGNGIYRAQAIGYNITSAAGWDVELSDTGFNSGEVGFWTISGQYGPSGTFTGTDATFVDLGGGAGEGTGAWLESPRGTAPSYSARNVGPVYTSSGLGNATYTAPTSWTTITNPGDIVIANVRAEQDTSTYDDPTVSWLQTTIEIGKTGVYTPVVSFTIDIRAQAIVINLA